MTIATSIIVIILRITSIRCLVVQAFTIQTNPFSNHQHQHHYHRHPSFLRFLPPSSSISSNPVQWSSSRHSNNNNIREIITTHRRHRSAVTLASSPPSSSDGNDNDDTIGEDKTTEDFSATTPTLQFQKETLLPKSSPVLPLQQQQQQQQQQSKTATSDTINNEIEIDDSTNMDNAVVETIRNKISYEYDLTSASESILAIDPSTIEIVPLSQIAQKEKDELARTRNAISTTTTTITQQKSKQTIKPSSTTSTTATADDTSQPPDFVSMFRGSANYIANHRNTIVVYHIPGELLASDSFPELMDDIALTWLLGMKPVIVAGCRKQIDDKMKKRRREIKQQQAGTIEQRDASVSSSLEGEQEKQQDQDQDQPRQYDGSIRVTDYDALRIVKEEAGYLDLNWNVSLVVRFVCIKHHNTRITRNHPPPIIITTRITIAMTTTTTSSATITIP